MNLRPVLFSIVVSYKCSSANAINVVQDAPYFGRRGILKMKVVQSRFWSNQEWFANCCYFWQKAFRPMALIGKILQFLCLRAASLLLLIGFISSLAGADDTPSIQPLQEIIVGPADGVTQLNLYYASPKEPVAVFVLLSYNGGKPREIADKTRQDIQPWVDFAAQRRLAFIYADICGTRSFPPSIIAGNRDATEGLNQLLVEGMTKALAQTLPVCFYPYHGDLTATNIEIALANQRADGVAAWCLANRVPDKSIPIRSTAPVLFTVANDDIDYDLDKKYYQQQRSNGGKWTWLGYKPSDTESVESLICQYFQSVTASPPGLCKFADPNATPVLGEDLQTNPQAIWFPTTEVASAWKEIESEPVQHATIIEKTIDPDSPGTVPLHFYLRLPPGASDGTGVSGVLAYCTWVQDPRSIRQQLLLDTNRPEDQMTGIGVEMLCYAAKHNLAVLTWSTPGNWQPGKSSDQLSWDDRRRIDQMFDVYGRVWNDGVDQLVDQYKIPANDYLLYGISRGAQWAHRLVLRRPGRFLAINIHIASSYDIPTPEASQCLWLVTTGDLEHGCPFAKTFYGQCQKLGYPIIFKVEENLGHDTCSEVEHLRDNFFDYALAIKKERDAGNISKTDMAAIIAKRLMNAPFIGDYLNQDVSPASEASEVPSNLRVYLPNDDIANAWAVQHVPEVAKK